MSGLDGAKSVARLLFGHFYYKTKVKLTLFTFLACGPQWNAYFCFNIVEITSFTMLAFFWIANGGQWGPTGQGNLGMVVVTTRDGPKVYHLKQDSPLSGVVDEGDIICSVDDKNTRFMTATSLRRFLRNNESSNERVIQVLGRRAEAHSSGDESL